LVIQIKIIIKTFINRGADGEFHLVAKKFPHGVGHEVGGGMADGI
jgi:hypothetical protein